MVLPSELQYIIISFDPRSEFIPVCKDWNEKIKSIRQKAANTIGKWYKPKRINIEYTTVPEMVRCFVIHYPDNLFLMRPEASVLKLGLNYELLTVMPPLLSRKRREVRDWMLNMPISFLDWIYVGW
jgi:hypothetical protein